jgi:hypothetical protein
VRGNRRHAPSRVPCRRRIIRDQPLAQAHRVALPVTHRTAEIERLGVGAAHLQVELGATQGQQTLLDREHQCLAMPPAE